LHLARTLVGNGAVDCALVIGFEKMKPGALTGGAPDRAAASGLSRKMMEELWGATNAPRNPQFFGNAGREYMEKYGAKPEDFAEIARISHEHSSRNPYAQFQDVFTLKQILDSPMIHAPLTKLQCSPTSDGAASAVVVSQKFLDARPHLKKQAILIAGQQLATDTPDLYSRSAIELVGSGMTRVAVKSALDQAGVSIKDIKVCELHDCFSANELVLLESLGFSERGKAHEMVRRKEITYGGRVVINPSGGLISKGHPLGATGLAQCAELTWQLRGWANNRLVEDTAVALQHNLGLGGATVVTVYKRADGQKNKAMTDTEIVKNSQFDYNPATKAKYITLKDAEKIRSKKSPSDWALGDLFQTLQSRL